MERARRRRMEGWLICILISLVASRVESTGKKIWMPNQLDGGKILRHVTGHSGDLGSLWNDVTGQLFFSAKVFTGSIPESCKTTTKIPLSDFGSYDMTNITKRFEQLEISDEDQLHPFVPYANMDHLRIDGSSNLTHKYFGKDVYSLNAKIRLAEETLNINHSELIGLYNPERFKLDLFTHIVTGIIKGVFLDLRIINSKRNLTTDQDTELKELLNDAAKEMNRWGEIREKTRRKIVDLAQDFSYEWKSIGYNGYIPKFPEESINTALKIFENVPQSIQKNDLMGSPIFFVLTPIEEFYQFLPPDFALPNRTSLGPISDDGLKDRLLKFSQDFYDKRRQAGLYCELLKNEWRVMKNITSFNSLFSPCDSFKEAEFVIGYGHQQILYEMRTSSPEGSPEDYQKLVENFLKYVENSLYSNENITRLNEYLSRPVRLMKALDGLKEANVEYNVGDSTISRYMNMEGRTLQFYFDSRQVQNDTFMEMFFKHRDKLLAIKKHDGSVRMVMTDCATYDCKPPCRDRDNYVCIAETNKSFRGGFSYMPDLFSHWERNNYKCGVQVNVCSNGKGGEHGEYPWCY